MFTDHNKLRQTLVDAYHNLGNVVNDSRNLLFNKKGSGQRWTRKRREQESSIGRFLGVGKQAPWHVLNWPTVHAYLRQLKAPTGWELLRNFCDCSKTMKIAERLACLSDRGCYILGLCEFGSPTVKRLFIALFQKLGIWLTKGDPASVDDEKVHQALVHSYRWTCIHIYNAIVCIAYLLFKIPTFCPIYVSDSTLRSPGS